MATKIHPKKWVLKYKYVYNSTKNKLILSNTYGKINFENNFYLSVFKVY